MPAPDDRDLGDRGVGGHVREAQVAHDGVEQPPDLGELDRGDREGQVGRARVAHVLDDEVDVDARVRERVEHGARDARPVRHPDEGHLGDLAVERQAAHLVAQLHGI